MYEKYSMIHHEFGYAGSGLPESELAQVEREEPDIYAEVMKADYRLRGWVDVLPVYPQAEDLFHRRLHLQSFSYMYSTSDYYTSRKDAASYLIVKTHRGKGILEYQEHEYLLEEGSLFWIDCHKPHTYRTEGDFWEHTDIHIHGADVQGLYQEFEKRGSCVLQGTGHSDFHQDAEAMLEAYITLGTHRSMRITYAIETLLVHLITAEEPKQVSVSGSTERLQELVRYMHEHYKEALTMDQLADLSGFSKYHLSREFKKLTGFPPNEYLIRLRLEQAKVLLVNTDLPVYRVGVLSGIENEAYFSRLFRQRMHCTPAEYRRSH